MRVESLNINTTQGATTAYVDRPQEDSDVAIVLIQEYWGINDHIRDLAGRYAKEGYLCVAPETSIRDAPCGADYMGLLFTKK